MRAQGSATSSLAKDPLFSGAGSYHRNRPLLLHSVLSKSRGTLRLARVGPETIAIDCTGQRLLGPVRVELSCNTQISSPGDPVIAPASQRDRKSSCRERG